MPACSHVWIRSYAFDIVADTYPEWRAFRTLEKMGVPAISMAVRHTLYTFQLISLAMDHG